MYRVKYAAFSCFSLLLKRWIKIRKIKFKKSSKLNLSLKVRKTWSDLLSDRYSYKCWLYVYKVFRKNWERCLVSQRNSVIVCKFFERWSSSVALEYRLRRVHRFSQVKSTRSELLKSFNLSFMKTGLIKFKIESIFYFHYISWWNKKCRLALKNEWDRLSKSITIFCGL